MPRLSRADSSLVVEILEQTLAASSGGLPRARQLEAIVGRLRGRIAQATVASGERAQRQQDDASPRVTASTSTSPAPIVGALS
ncbi:MAG: hypothetical protein FJ148_06185 [Deltaproteobacteria bacterium]|nr:hypothetical protein [Deltaproteobacteria bacterium]